MIRIVMLVMLRAGLNAGIILVSAILLALWANGALAAPYAAMVMDARNGEVLFARNADTKLHPASLTKMMTLYVAIEAVKNGEISLDTKVKISKFAASEPPSKLYMKPGSRISLRYLMRAAAVRSANDAATAIAEAISGSESAFAKRMNRTAAAMGMKNTTFRNAHGLTQKGHRSTARDMSTLARHVIYDYPDYYNLFSRIKTSVGNKTIYSTNRKFLSAYRGADGIKTGFTNAAGFNLVGSAQRGGKRIIATVFGGRSVATRNAHVSELLDLGFQRAHTEVAVRMPDKPNYASAALALAQFAPMPRPGFPEIEEQQGTVSAIVAAVVSAGDGELPVAVGDGGEPVREAEPVTVQVEMAPKRRPFSVLASSFNISETTRFGIHLGDFSTRQAAERRLLKAALMDFGSIVGATKLVQPVGNSYAVRFIGLTEANANKACARLNARGIDCSVSYLQ